MKKNSKVKSVNTLIQEHCIDLPGEKVQCWVGATTTGLKVILRKHRDVIFDINIGSSNRYTLESTESDFYSVRDKKLIFSARHGTITFNDGEKLHVWVSRRFRGALVVKLGGHTISRVAPNELDGNQYDGAPKVKPAPIIIALSNNLPASSPPLAQNQVSKAVPPVSHAAVIPRTPTAKNDQLTCPVVCVVDGDVKGMPAQLIEYFRSGGDKSGFADIDPNSITTRNWIWGQVAGAGAYTKDNWAWLRASMDEKTSKGFQLVKARVHFVRGKVRFYFSGYSNANTVFGRGGFGPGNDRIMTIFSGVGKTESTFGATVKGVAGTFKGNALISFIFGSATAIAEWKADTQKDGYDLAAALITTTVKAILVAVAVSVIVAVFVWLSMVIAGASVSVLAVGAVTVIAGIGVGYLIEVADKSAGSAIMHNPSNTDGVAGTLAPALREASKLIEKNWEYLMSKMSGDYQEIRFDSAM